MKDVCIVVEGKNDKEKIKRLYKDVIVVETNGSAIDIDKINLLKELSKTKEIIIFTDPDHAGERIRRILSKELINVSHAFIDKELSISKNFKKTGIEHASLENLKESLSHLMITSSKSSSDVTYSFLYDLKLIGHKDSKEVRNELAKKLNIGHVNGKTLFQRLKIFNINQSDLLEVLKT